MATPYMEDQDASETLQRLQNLGRLDLTHMLHQYLQDLGRWGLKCMLHLQILDLKYMVHWMVGHYAHLPPSLQDPSNGPAILPSLIPN